MINDVISYRLCVVLYPRLITWLWAGEVYRSSLDAPLSEMGDGLQWGRFSKAKPHFRAPEEWPGIGCKMERMVEEQ